VEVFLLCRTLVLRFPLFPPYFLDDFSQNQQKNFANKIKRWKIEKINTFLPSMSLMMFKRKENHKRSKKKSQAQEDLPRDRSDSLFVVFHVRTGKEVHL
jgi:hypothetical protein